MIQFNLLPDVKLAYVKAQRSKHLVLVIASVTAGLAVVIFILLFLVVNVAQKKHLSDLNKDIKTDSTQLQNTPDLNKILTVQNQLDSLPALHQQKPVSSRLFTFLSQLTPVQASIGKLHLDFTTNTMTISGDADDLSTVNTYVDTLKFTTFDTADKSKHGPAFSKVVLSSFSRNEQATSYEITCTFDATIFNIASEVTLTVPKTITTRSETEKPADLFKKTETTTNGN